MKKNRLFENIVHGIFLILGLITVGCVLLITVYLIISGIPAIKEIGFFNFLFGKEWASTAAEPKYGILPFILTSVYGTAGAILIGVPIGFFTAVYLSKVANKKVRAVIEAAVNLLAGIPSVVYGFVGMLVLVPAIRAIFDVPDGASLLAAIIVLAIMILPNIIKVSITALDAVPKEYEDASLALGATPTETFFKVSVPAAKSGIAAAVVLGVGRAIGEAMAVMLPGKDGVEILEEIRSNPETRKIPVIMATAKGTEMDKIQGLDTGADDYLVKPFGVMEMVSRIKAVLRRCEPDEKEEVLSIGKITLSDNEHLVTVNGEKVVLTFKEFEILKLFMSNPGIVFSRDKLLSEVWGIDYLCESRTVDMHIKTLRQKLGDAGALIETVIGVGYKMEGKR